MSANELSVIAGILLSLAFSYIPGLNVKFAELDPLYKRLIMLGLLVAAAAGVFGLACSPLAAELGLKVACDKAGAIGLASQLVLAIIANQSAFLISPKPAEVQAARNFQRDSTSAALA